MTPVEPTGAPPRPALGRGLTLTAAAVLLAFIATGGRRLWHEWTGLGSEQAQVRRTVVVGYPGITPRVSFATKPAGWIHDEGKSTLIWCGWKDGAGHQWFRTGLGDLERDSMSDPIGRDVIQAIDVPVVESQGGEHWARIPDESFVVGQPLGGVETAYPMLVLNKVFVVNDTIADQPYLVAINPSVPRDERVGVYETVIEGRRVTMGLTGYFYEGKPLLYDRGTESLWVDRSGAWQAIAGIYKGRALRRVARPVPIAWGRWRSEHPGSRLVVGADRSRPMPAL